MKKILFFLKKYWMSISLCLIILYLCLMDTAPLPKIQVSNFDKFVHFVMFFTISGVIFFESTSYFRKRISTWKIIGFAFFFPVIYGGLIEVAQEYLPVNRAGDWMDFEFNVIGISVALIICLLINKRLPEAKKKEI